MYCVGSPPHQFVSVTVRDGVDAAMLSMYMEVTHGGCPLITRIEYDPVAVPFSTETLT